jgi:hypothetical protein
LLIGQSGVYVNITNMDIPQQDWISLPFWIHTQGQLIWKTVELFTAWRMRRFCVHSKPPRLHQPVQVLAAVMKQHPPGMKNDGSSFQS